MKAIQVGGWTCSQRPDAGGSLWAPDCVWGLYTLSASAWGSSNQSQRAESFIIIAFIDINTSQCSGNIRFFCLLGMATKVM